MTESKQLEAAKALLENWESHIDCGGCMVICGAEEISWHVPAYLVVQLLAAATLVAEERVNQKRRDDFARRRPLMEAAVRIERKRCAEIVKKEMTLEPFSTQLQEKILNQTGQ